MQDGQQPAGWYPAEGDPPGTVRWWDGTKWVGGPQAQGAQQQAGFVAPNASQLPSGRDLANPWLRLAAWIIDFIIVFAVGIIFAVAFGVTDSIGAILSGGGTEIDSTFFISSAIATLITTLYVVLMNSYASGTLGKLILGIRIIGRAGDEPLGLPLGAKRSANTIVGFLFGLIPLVGGLLNLVFVLIGLVSLVFLFTDPEHRTVMDRFADTLVVTKAN